MTYTIPRPKWKRGDMENRSMFDRADEIGCVLYHVGIQSGISHEHMLDMPTLAKETPIHVRGYLHVWPSWMITYDHRLHRYQPTRDCESVMDINDRTDITEYERETTLTGIFARNLDELRFVE